MLIGLLFFFLRGIGNARLGRFFPYPWESRFGRLTARFLPFNNHRVPGRNADRRPRPTGSKRMAPAHVSQPGRVVDAR